MTDQQDYQDYLAYQKHISGQSGIAMPSQGLPNPNDPGVHQQMVQAAKHPVTGMEDPVYQAIGMTSEAPITALLKGIPKIGNALKTFLTPAAQRAEARTALKGPEALDYLQKTAGNTAEKFNKTQISPRMLEQESRLKGNTIRINPEELKGVSPELDQYANSISVKKPDPYGLYGRQGGAVSTGSEAVTAEKAPQTVVTHGYEPDPVPTTDPAGYSTISNATKRPEVIQQTGQSSVIRGESTPGIPAKPVRQMEPMGEAPNEPSIEIPAEEGLKIRKMLNDSAGWKTHPLDPTKAKALDDKAAALHQMLSDKFNTIDQAMTPLSQEMQQAYNTQKIATGSGKIPKVPGVSSSAVKDAAVQKYGQMTGTDLQGLGDVADESMKSGMVNPFSMTSPKGVVKEAVRTLSSPARRGYDTAAQGFINGPELSNSDKLKMLRKMLTPSVSASPRDVGDQSQ